MAEAARGVDAWVKARGKRPASSTPRAADQDPDLPPALLEVRLP